MSGGAGGPRPPRLDLHGLTHAGRRRADNQDHFLIGSLDGRLRVHGTSLPATEGLGNVERATGGEPPSAVLAVVADGVGGGARGEEASRLAVVGVARAVADTILGCEDGEVPADFVLDGARAAALRCHAELRRRGGEQTPPVEMASTLTLWLGLWPRAFLLHVGDSRCYALDGAGLSRVTRDQTLAEALVEQGVDAGAAHANPRWANVLSSALGGPDVQPVAVGLPGGWVGVRLLCTDGLTKHVPEERIAERLRTARSARAACEGLLQDALDGGGTDNVTVVVARPVADPPRTSR